MSTEQNTIATMVRAFAEIIERQVLRFENQGAEYERKLAEHRASFGARTEADAKIIEGLRADVEDLRNRLNSLGIQAAKQANIALGMVEGEGLLGAAKRVVKERDALRAEVEQLRADIAEELNESPPTPKQHPVKVGEWVECIGDPGRGTKRQVLEVYANWYSVEVGHRWTFDFCRPCDPPEASHDTPAGKEAAESVIRDFRSGDSEVSITGLFDDTKITVRREPDQDHGSRIVIRDANDMGEANIYLTESGARQMATALIGLCDVRKVPQ